jgi:transposase
MSPFPAAFAAKWRCGLAALVVSSVFGGSQRRVAGNSAILAGGAIERHRYRQPTGVAALRIDGLTAPYVIDGAMDGPSFLAYVEQILAPTLRKGDIVFMDNLRTHKIAGAREAIEAVGAGVRYLPAYSPDLNPIGQAFSRLKAALRKGATRTVQALLKLIGKLVKSFARQMCANYFGHAGYIR